MEHAQHARALRAERGARDVEPLRVRGGDVEEKDRLERATRVHREGRGYGVPTNCATERSEGPKVSRLLRSGRIYDYNVTVAVDGSREEAVHLVSVVTLTSGRISHATRVAASA